MASMHSETFAALAAPFGRDEVKTRTQAGRQLSYVTARTVMNRLDTVLGPENWWDRYHSGGESSILCELTIRLPDGTTLTKCDAGGMAGMADSGDDEKSGYSDSFKRAAVKFGVGRYLYRDGVPSYGAPEPRQRAAEPAPAAPRAKAQGKWGGGVPAAGAAATVVQDPPRGGKAFFRWLADESKRTDVDLVKLVNRWAAEQRQGERPDLPARIVDWSPDDVLDAWEYARGRSQMED
jgi:hypothetical protein